MTLNRQTYLTEQSLGDYLQLIFPEVTDWVHDERFPNLSYRPDYRSDKLKLIVEFDGYHHFMKPSVILSDLKKTAIYENKGYKVIRIPHFVQLETNSIKYYFGKDIDLPMEYKHGFRQPGDSGYPPSTMSELGVCHFLVLLDKMQKTKEGRFIRRHVISSLRQQLCLLDTNEKELIVDTRTKDLLSEDFIPEDEKLLMSILSIPDKLDNYEQELFDERGIKIAEANYEQLQKLFDEGLLEPNGHEWYAPTNWEHYVFSQDHPRTKCFVTIYYHDDYFQKVFLSGICMPYGTEEEKQEFVKVWGPRAKKNGLFEKDNKISTVWR